MDTTFGLDLARVEALFKRELRRFDELHPRSAQAYRENRTLGTCRTRRRRAQPIGRAVATG